MRALFLGTGTSVGVPQVGCRCEVCTSSDPRDKRTRPSLLLETGGKRLLIDIGPDFRAQMLREGIESVDAVLLTHAHADHILGIDDLRAVNNRTGRSIPIYATERTHAVVRRVFFYCFESDPYASRPRFEPRFFGEAPFEAEGVEAVPVRAIHGTMEVHGFRFGKFAYITDAKVIPPESLALLEGVEVLVLNALRFRYHPTHFSVDEACAVVEKVGPERAFLTHMGHGIMHGRDSARLPAGVEFAWDGLEIEIGDG